MAFGNVGINRCDKSVDTREKPARSDSRHGFRGSCFVIHLEPMDRTWHLAPGRWPVPTAGFPLKHASAEVGFFSALPPPGANH